MVFFGFRNAERQGRFPNSSDKVFHEVLGFVCNLLKIKRIKKTSFVRRTLEKKNTMKVLLFEEKVVLLHTQNQKERKR